MSRFKFLFCMTLSSLAFLLCADRVDAGVMLGDVEAFAADETSLDVATAVHGFLVGNDTGSEDPLLTLLNFGTSTGQSATLVGPPEESIEISSTGMFSTSKTIGDPFVDLIDGSPVVRGDNWVFRGKSDDNPSFTFESNPEETYGTLVLKVGDDGISPLSGNVVLSLKAGNQYAVYAFAGLIDVASFEFKNLPKNLSHASLYTSTPSPITGPPGAVPEPASLAIFGFGVLGLGIGQLRRRRVAAAKTA